MYQSTGFDQLVQSIISVGGRPLVIGGAVRDHLLGLAFKDIDVEVFGLALPELEAALSLFKVDAVGRSFGVLKVTVAGETFDVSLPRTENKLGLGHRGFVVNSDPHMDLAAAAARRDYTINAIFWDPAGDRFIDPHDGRLDLRSGLLRHVSEAFDEDPLRVLRGCQFAARFGFEMAPTTIERCRRLQPELSTLAVERLWEEWRKLLLLSERPSVGLDMLQLTQALDLFPELTALIGVPQDPEWHPEGDVWTHTKLVLDAAALLATEEQLPDEERLILLLSAVCHDLGKPAVTVLEEGRWRSWGHEEAGVQPAASLLARMGTPPSLIDAVLPLVRLHLQPRLLHRSRAGDAAIRRLALKVPLRRLALLTRADLMGRSDPLPTTVEDEAVDWLMARAESLRLMDEAPRPLLLGRHLIAMGFAPGKQLGTMLAEAFEAQLEGAFDDEAGAVRWAAERFG